MQRRPRSERDLLGHGGESAQIPRKHDYRVLQNLHPAFMQVISIRIMIFSDNAIITITRCFVYKSKLGTICIKVYLYPSD